VHQALVGERAFLDAVRVLDLAGLHLHTPLAELVQLAKPLDRVVEGPVLTRQLVEAIERGPRGHIARA
jgi:hypothetical protein